MGADRLIYIRTDGNLNIAAGHLVRCLSIAQNCLKLGISVCFLLSDEKSQNLLEGFLTEDLKDNPALSLRILETAQYDDLERELPEVLNLLRRAAAPSQSCTPSKMRLPVYLLDSYFVTENYLKQIGTVAKVAYIDDLQLFDYPADLVINYDVISDSALPTYQVAYQKAGKTLLGAAYTPLRSQFEGKVISINEHVSNILVTTGGSDPYHFCTEFIQSYAEKFSKNTSWPIPTLHVVIGRLSKDKERLNCLAQEHAFLKLYENITDMATLMSTCDLAVSAAGTTLYEVCALGVPTISFTMADNQLTSAKAFEESGAIPCSGDIRTGKEQVLQQILTFIQHMSEGADSSSPKQPSGTSGASYQNRLHAHKTMRNLIDEKGALRIADELYKL